MLNYIKNNLIALVALFISAISIFLSISNHIKAMIKLKITYNTNNSYCFGFTWYDKYKLLIVDLTIENNSTTSIDISRIKLIDECNIFIASKFNIADMHNNNGISLINNKQDQVNCINITSENILNNTRIPSYGVLKGYAVFDGVCPIDEPKKYKMLIETPNKSFKEEIIIKPLNENWKPIYPLEN